MKRTVFFISDGTGITAETLGQSLITQFTHQVEFDKIVLPYIDTPVKAEAAKNQINAYCGSSDQRPLVFGTLVQTDIHKIIAESGALFIDLFQTFIGPLERELKVKSSHTIGRSHGVQDDLKYKTRIEAIDFSLATDDGVRTSQYDTADVILIGVSRSGKTPTCLYLALQFGVRAANYPFTEEDLEKHRLPEALKLYKAKLFGLMIDADRLRAIRQERRPDSKYSSLKMCQKELKALEELFHREKLPYLNTTTLSIEEIATQILAECRIQRRLV